LAESLTRIGGSGFTQFAWRGTTLAWLQVISDTAPRAVASAQPVQPLDARVPVEIVTARAVSAGTLRLTFFELWNGPVWTQLPGLEGATKLLDVLDTQVTLGDISCRKFIRRPNGGVATKVYLGCKITDAEEDETIQIQSMTLPKSITIMYTDTTG
jgi:hypothetical protein